jgi:uridylate kinase
MGQKPEYSRVLLKVSGEALMGSKDFGIDMDMAARVAGEVVRAVRDGVQVALVIGGGNIFRGVSGAAGGMDRANADQMGMLATVMNALAMQDVLQAQGVDARAMSAIPMPSVCEPFLRAKALRHLEKGRVVICAAGTGNPFFTTDTGATLRAAELKCDALLKGTSVDGVYSADPKKDSSAQRFDTLTYDEMLARNLKVMDAAAIALARDNAIPVIVFSIRSEGEFNKVLQGNGTFTRVTVS